MNAFLTYFRLHPWQRRVMTGLIAAIAGVSLACVLLPRLQDYRLIGRLGSASLRERKQAITDAVYRAGDRPEFVRRLQALLGEADDEQFAAAGEVLRRIGKFPPPGRVEYEDRLYSITLAEDAKSGAGPALRIKRLRQLTVSGRDNAYVRRALAIAAADGEAVVRAEASLLAARLADDVALSKLLADESPAVRGAAALNAALAGRDQLTPTIAEVFASAKDAGARADAAYALARLAPQESRAPIAIAIAQEWQKGRGALVDKLLHVATLMGVCDAAMVAASDFGEETVPGAIRYVLRSAKLSDRTTPDMALLAAGKIGLADAREYVLAAIATILKTDKTKLTIGDARRLAAAIEAADALGEPAGLFTDVMAKLWHGRTTPAMVLSAEAVGRRAGEGAALDNGGIVNLLVLAAEADKAPLASAAAAAALLKWDPERGASLVREALTDDVYLVGDYVAWRLSGRDGPGDGGADDARRVAESLLAPGERNHNVRGAAAMWLAMLARGSDWADKAAEPILRRLQGGPYAPERDPYLAASYKCALLILGRDEFADDVVELLRGTDFPPSRSLTALVLAGRPEAMDYIFKVDIGEAGILSDLAGWQRKRVLAAEQMFAADALLGRLLRRQAPELPPYDLAAPAGVRLWQRRIMRNYYYIHRRAILDRMKP